MRGRRLMSFLLLPSIFRSEGEFGEPKVAIVFYRAELWPSLVETVVCSVLQAASRSVRARLTER